MPNFHKTMSRYLDSILPKLSSTLSAPMSVSSGVSGATPQIRAIAPL